MGKWGAIAVTVLGAAGFWLLSPAVTAPPRTDAAPEERSPLPVSAPMKPRLAHEGALPDCVTGRERLTVRGGSLGSLIQEGATLELLRGYYSCRTPERGELVAIHRAGSTVPIAKVVHGLPGDSFRVEAATGGFILLLNGTATRNTQGERFALDARSWRVLNHFAQTYGGKIPAGTFLVLGDVAKHTVDSRAFGLVAQSELLGRLTVPRR